MPEIVDPRCAAPLPLPVAAEHPFICWRLNTKLMAPPSAAPTKVVSAPTQTSLLIPGA
jgi:hypothetical protein